MASSSAGGVERRTVNAVLVHERLAARSTRATSAHRVRRSRRRRPWSADPLHMSPARCVSSAMVLAAQLSAAVHRQRSLATLTGADTEQLFFSLLVLYVGYIFLLSICRLAGSRRKRIAQGEQTNDKHFGGTSSTEYPAHELKPCAVISLVSSAL